MSRGGGVSVPDFLNSTWRQYRTRGWRQLLWWRRPPSPAEQVRAGLQYMRDRYGDHGDHKGFWDGAYWYGQ
jgi:hypothetical protein